jgi:hypothetical protein
MAHNRARLVQELPLACQNTSTSSGRSRHLFSVIFVLDSLVPNPAVYSNQMAFVRKKVVKGKTYYQLVECRWEDGRPRQKVIAYLGRFATVRGAHAYWIRESDTPGRKTQAAKMLKKLRPYI